jgi:hypothetical protein
LGFNHYDNPQIKGGAFFDTKVAENTYNESTLNMTSKLATVTTGVKRFFYSSPHGTVGLFATAKAGVATGDGSATAVFGGGGGIKVFLAGAATKFPIPETVQHHPQFLRERHGGCPADQWSRRIPHVRVRDWGGLQIGRSAGGMTMISDLLRQVGAGLAEFLEREAGHVIVLMILIWWGTSSWPCTSISASVWPIKPPAHCSTH